MEHLNTQFLLKPVENLSSAMWTQPKSDHKIKLIWTYFYFVISTLTEKYQCLDSAHFNNLISKVDWLSTHSLCHTQNLWLSLSTNQHSNCGSEPPPTYQDLKLSICQSGWGEIRNALRVICWVRWGSELGSWHCFADQMLLTRVKLTTHECWVPQMVCDIMLQVLYKYPYNDKARSSEKKGLPPKGQWVWNDICSHCCMLSLHGYLTSHHLYHSRKYLE